jgi:hypothetical protein
MTKALGRATDDIRKRFLKENNSLQRIIPTTTFDFIGRGERSQPREREIKNDVLGFAGRLR